MTMKQTSKVNETFRMASLSMDLYCSTFKKSSLYAKIQPCSLPGMESMVERIESIASMVAAVFSPFTCVPRIRVETIVGGVVVLSNFTSETYRYPPGLDGCVMNLYSLSLYVLFAESFTQFFVFQISGLPSGGGSSHISIYLSN